MRTQVRIVAVAVVVSSPLQFSPVHAQQDTIRSRWLLVIPAPVLMQLPIDEVHDLLGLRAGSFLVPGNRTTHRGFAEGSEAVYLDGVPVTNQLFGTTLLTLPLAAVSRTTLTASGAPARFGNTQSGILAIASHRGAGAWQGGLDLYTDEFSPWSEGTNRLQLGARGGMGSRFGMSVGFSAHGQRSTDLVSAFQDIPLYRQSGVDTVVQLPVPGAGDVREVLVPNFEEIDSDLLPRSANDRYRAFIRGDWRVRSGSALFVELLAAREQARVPFGGSCAAVCPAFLPGTQSGRFHRSRGVILGWEQDLGAFAGGTVAVEARLARLWSRIQNGPLEPAFAFEHDNPPLGFTLPDFEFLVDRSDFPADEALVDRLLRNQRPFTPFDPTRTDLSPSQEFRFNPYARAAGFPIRGIPGEHELGVETGSYVRLAAHLTRADHQVEVGTELHNAEVGYVNVGLIGPVGSPFFEQPHRLAVYLHDRLRMGRVSGEIGLRYDRVDPNTTFPVTPGFIDPDDPETSFAAEAQSALSPIVAFDVSLARRARAQLSLVRSVELPSALNYYFGKNTHFSRSMVGDVFGRPIGLQRSTALAASFSWNLFSSSFVQLAGFDQRHDDVRTVRGQFFDHPTIPGSALRLDVPVLRAGPRYRGVTLRWAKEPAADAAWDVAYTYETATDPPSEPGIIFFSAEHKRHGVAGYVAHDLGSLSGWNPARGMMIAATARLSSAHKFLIVSPLFPDGFGEGSVKGFSLLDLRLSRTVRLVGLAGRVVLDGRNVLGSSPSVPVDETTLGFSVLADRRTLGGGLVVDRVDLTSLQQAGEGVRNAADLAALRQAERRFGNGDRLFTAEEQVRAFEAAHRFLLAAQSPGGTLRRLRFGVELHF